MGATDCAMLTSLTSLAQGLVDFGLGSDLLTALDDHGSRVTRAFELPSCCIMGDTGVLKCCAQAVSFIEEVVSGKFPSGKFVTLVFGTLFHGSFVGLTNDCLFGLLGFSKEKTSGEVRLGRNESLIDSLS